MTQHLHYTVPAEWLSLNQEQGWDALPELLTVVINAVVLQKLGVFLSEGIGARGG
jgi:hypothetical protein